MDRSAFVLVLLLLAPLATAASHEGRLPSVAQDRHARALHILAYHPYPDLQGDPWGFPTALRNGTEVGHMEATYGAVQYPTAVFDGVLRVEGSSGFLDTHRIYEDRFQQRRERDPAATIAIGGVNDGARAGIEVDLVRKRPIESNNLTLRIVLFEDEIRFDGGNGVELHRFTVRRVLHDAPIVFLPNGTAQARVMALLDPAWTAHRLGVVASLHNRDPQGRDAAPGEVLQAATFLFRQDEPTLQTSKGVLLEYLTATWCPACLYGDGVVEDLANAYGVPNSRLLDREWRYLRPPGGPALVAAAVAGLLVALVGAAWRRGGVP